MKPTIWLPFRLDEDLMENMAQVADVIPNATEADLPGVDMAIVGGRSEVDGTFMDEVGPNLKAIIRIGIGVDNIRIPDATERGILVANTPDAPTESTAEHTVALLLSIAKRVVMGNDFLRGTDLPRTAMRGTEVRGRTLGIAGLGRIGRRVGEICAQGLKMRVIGFDPFVQQADVADLGIEKVDDLDRMIADVDFLTLHVPLMPETHHLMNEERLRSMKPGAYLINASRGPVVDEAALIKVLQADHLSGAALDVFDPEPPAADNSLLHMANVVATPHIASFTDMGSRAMQSAVAAQAVQVAKGERPTYLLNPEVWPGRMQSTSSTHHSS